MEQPEVKKRGVLKVLRAVGIAAVSLIIAGSVIFFFLPVHKEGAEAGRRFDLATGQTQAIKGTKVSITLLSTHISQSGSFGLCPGVSLSARVTYGWIMFPVWHDYCGNHVVNTPFWFPYEIEEESIFADHVTFRIYPKGGEEAQALLECEEVYPKFETASQKDVRTACFKDLERRFGKTFADPRADQPFTVPVYECEGMSGKAAGDCWYMKAQQENDASFCAFIEPGHDWDGYCWVRVAGKTGNKEACANIKTYPLGSSEETWEPWWGQRRYLCENSCNPDIGCDDEDAACLWDAQNMHHACMPTCDPDVGCDRDDMKCVALQDAGGKNVCIPKTIFEMEGTAE